jgi:DNA-binding GntR family transcriptional regulator
MSKDILSKVEPRSPEHNANEWVYNSLCQLILSGEFVPGISFTFRGIANSFGC